MHNRSDKNKFGKFMIHCQIKRKFHTLQVPFQRDD